MNLVKKGVLKPFADGASLDLAIYESINVVWKKYKLLKRLDKATALALLDVMNGLFDVMNLLSIKAWRWRFSTLLLKKASWFIDSSYIPL